MLILNFCVASLFESIMRWNAGEAERCRDIKIRECESERERQRYSSAFTFLRELRILFAMMKLSKKKFLVGTLPCSMVVPY